MVQGQFLQAIRNSGEVTLRAVAAALIAGLLLSPKLWVSTRFYPLTPVLALLGPLPYPLDYAAYCLLLALLTATLLTPTALTRHPRLWIAPSLILLAALCAQDQSRLQPWCYQYALMLAALFLANRLAAENICRLIIAATYFWSGAQKLNPFFASTTFTYLAHPFAARFPSLVIAAGHAAPFLEIAGAIALLTRRFRTAAIAALIAMHAFILLSIGPLGHTSNTVVWPWNLAMIAFLLILYRGSEAHPRDILWSPAPFHRVVFALLVLAPALSFFNLWDSYLSVSLYSGNRNQATIYMTEAVAAHLPDEADQDLDEVSPNLDKILVNDWSFDELNAPAYPETRIFKNAARKLCLFAANPSDVRLEIQGKSVLANQTGRLSITCSQLR